MAKDGRMQEVLQQFRVIVHSIKRHYRSVESKSGVGGAQLWALSVVAERPGITVTGLAMRLAIHQSTASNLVNRLCELELLAKVRDGEDQRVVQLRPTPAGRRVLRTAPRPVIGLLQQALMTLPPSRLDALQKELSEVIRRMPRRQARAKTLPLSEL